MSGKVIHIEIKRRHLIFFFLVLIIFIGILIACLFNLMKCNQKYRIEASFIDIDPNAGYFNGASEENKSVDSIKICGYPSIQVCANQQDQKVLLSNPEGNPCYFAFELILRDTGESLYKSKQIPPGQSVSEITLSRSLNEGKYEAVLRISTTSVLDGSQMNGANMKTELIVK